MSEALKQLAFRSFSDLRLQSLYAWTMEDNKASIRFLQKVGFRESGRIRRATSSGGRQVDRIYFDLLADEVLPAQ